MKQRATYIGYARVSTGGQDLALQRDALRTVGCSRIFEEKISGAKRSRPQLERLLDHLREGDVLVVTRLDRLARSTRDLLDLGERLAGMGANLKSLAEPWADTTSPTGKMVLSILASIAEFERSLILERTHAGRQAARARGVAFGRKPVLNDDQLTHAAELVENGEKSLAEAAKLFGVHRTTVYRALRRRAGA